MAIKLKQKTFLVEMTSYEDDDLKNITASDIRDAIFAGASSEDEPISDLNITIGVVEVSGKPDDPKPGKSQAGGKAK